MNTAMKIDPNSLINPIDLTLVRSQYLTAEPFPFFSIDNFLREDFAREVAATYPSFDEARVMGRQFDRVNERLKVQVTESQKFPEPVRKLATLLESQAWLATLRQITGIDALLADPELAGGGIHVTGPGGRLDVHVDFNYITDRDLHRRLNVLIYLNPIWEENWGGDIELWDKDVKKRHHVFSPIFNRCVAFQTSAISFHGVTPVRAPHPHLRKSFATYYYTKEAPDAWDGSKHSTIFRARPYERFKMHVAMPLEQFGMRMRQGMDRAKRRVRQLISPK